MKIALILAVSLLSHFGPAHATVPRPTFSCACIEDACSNISFFAKGKFKDQNGVSRMAFEIEHIDSGNTAHTWESSMTLPEYRIALQTKSFRLMSLGDRSISFGGSTSDVTSLFEIHQSKGVWVVPDEGGNFFVRQIKCY